MMHPRVVLCAYDDWLGLQLREGLAERRWVLREFRLPSAWADAAAERGPCTAVIQLDFSDEKLGGLEAVVEVRLRNPDAEIVVVCDTKLAEEDRALWLSTALDLGARLVLFPPLTRPVLEDAVLGLLEHRIGQIAEPAAAEIDLADGEFESEAE